MDAKPMTPAEIAGLLRDESAGLFFPEGADCIDAQAAEITALRAELAEARLQISGGDMLIHAANLERDALAARVAGLEGALIYLRTSAAVLQQHAEDCAVQYHGCDFDREGMPGWLADTRSSIDRAAALSPSAQDARDAE